MTTEPVAISVKQAADLLGISVAHAYEMNRVGQLPGAYRMGRRVLVHLETLRAESAKRAQGSAA